MVVLKAMIYYSESAHSQQSLGETRHKLPESLPSGVTQDTLTSSQEWLVTT